MATYRVVRILYTNWEGKTEWRRIIPKSIYFGSNQWHKEPQWLIDAWDYDKQAMRSFALAGVHKAEGLLSGSFLVEFTFPEVGS